MLGLADFFCRRSEVWSTGSDLRRTPQPKHVGSHLAIGEDVDLNLMYLGYIQYIRANKTEYFEASSTQHAGQPHSQSSCLQRRPRKWKRSIRWYL